MLLLFLLVAPAFIGSPERSLADGYVWPLEAARAMSSSFGEYRSGHFHAGLDLKTWGRAGLPVKAIADGQVLRLRTSPWGYGKAVYLQSADGVISVYAHLSAFAPRIDSAVRDEQRRQNRYTIDLLVTPGAIPIRRGEIIGYSGESGAGPPHLHFELRDPDNRPFNPLLDQSFALPDSISPVIDRIAFVPGGGTSTVDGGCEPVVLSLREERDDTFTTTRVPVLSGQVVPAVSAYDMADGSDSRFDVYLISASVDGKPSYSVRYDRFSYDETDLIDLDRNMLLNVLGLGIFYNLSVLQGNSLTFHNGLPAGAGLLGSGNGTGRDSPPAGNWPAGSLPDLVRPGGSPPGEHYLRGSLPGDDRIAPSSRDLGRVLPSGPGILHPGLHGSDTLCPGLHESDTLRPGPHELTVEVADIRGNTSVAVVGFRVTAEPPGGNAPIPCSPKGSHDSPVVTILREPGGRATFLNGAVVVDIPEHGLYDDSISVSARKVAARRAEGLRPIRPASHAGGPAAAGLANEWACSLSPIGVPLAKKIRVSIAYPPGTAKPEQLAVYSYAKSRWWFLGNDLDRVHSTVSATTRSFGTYALFRDDTPPAVGIREPEARAGSGGLRMPLLSASVGDAGSGIGREEDALMFLDGVKLIAEYDPEGGTLACRVEKPLAAGSHRVEVRARDRSGNSRTTARSFAVDARR